MPNQPDSCLKLKLKLQAAEQLISELDAAKEEKDWEGQYLCAVVKWSALASAALLTLPRIYVLHIVGSSMIFCLCRLIDS